MTPGTRIMRGVRDEAGVVAVVVALAVSGFLLALGALAVDVGTAYVRKAEIGSLADRLALAGAGGLPDVRGPAGALAQIATAVRTVCAEGGADAVPGLCDAPATWATDGDPANGEVRFYGDAGQRGDLADRNGDGVLDARDEDAGATRAVGIRVELPPSTVPFGFGSAVGIGSGTVVGTATARIGTALGAGVLPFGLTQADLTRGTFCVRDPAVTGTQSPPAPTGWPFPTVWFVPVQQTVTSGARLQVSLFSFASLSGVRIHVSTGSTAGEQPTPAAQAAGLGTYTFTVPPGVDGSTVRLWATGRAGSTPFVSTSVSATYTASAGDPVCSAAQGADRGFLQIARADGASDPLAANIRTAPQVKLYPSGGLLGTLGTTVGCVATVFAPSSTCVTPVTNQQFRQPMTDGLFGSQGGTPGRLIGDCGGGTTSSGPVSGVDASRLIAGSRLLDGAFGSGTLSRLAAGAPAQNGDRGVVTSRALSCGRLAVMPVLNPLDPVAGAVAGQSISRFTYVWIDGPDATRGLTWQGDRLRSFRGTVVDPAYLPSLVAGSPRVGPYLGPDLPKEAVLIPDLADPGGAP